MLIGQAATNNNSFQFQYNHVGAGSTNNYMWLLPYGNMNTGGSLYMKADGNVGIGITNPPSKFFVNQSFTSTPEEIPVWSSAYSIFSNSSSNTSAGLGIVMNSSGTSAAAYIVSCSPSSSWNNINFGYSRIYFKSNTTAGGGFNIDTLGTGTVYSNGGTLTTTNPSDQTMKNTILPLTDNITIINQLKPISFLWNDTAKYGSKLNIGFVAQEVQKVLPNICSENKIPIEGAPQVKGPDGMLVDQYETKLGLDIVSLIPILVGAMKEQQVLIEQQHKMLEKQQLQINQLLSKSPPS